MIMNPFWRLHYHLNGGWRRLLATVVIYLALLAGGWYMGYRVSVASELARHPDGTALPATKKADIAAGVSSSMMWWVAGSQALFLLALAPMAIRKAVLTDYQSGMIESHRLSPLSGLRVVIGYLTAAPMQAFALYAASLLIGMYFAVDMSRGLGVAATGAMQAWMSGQILLFSLALLLSAVAALFALHSQGKMGKVFFPFLIIGVMSGGGMLLRLVPGVSLIIGYLAGQTIFAALQTGGLGGGIVGPIAGWSILAQFACSALFIAAASRKLRSPDGALFGLPLGLLFMLIVGAGSVAGMVYSGIDLAFGDTLDETAHVQLAATLVLLLLLGYYPLSAAAHDQVAAERAAKFGEHRAPHRRYYAIVIPLLLTLVLFMVAAGSLNLLGIDGSWYKALMKRTGNGAVFAAFFLQYLMDFAIISMRAARGKKVFAAIVFVFIVFRLIPLGLDAGQAVTTAIAQGVEPELVHARNFFSHISPFGTLLIAFGGEPNAWAGVGVQALLTAMLVFLWRRAAKRAPARIPTARPQSVPASA